MTSPEAVRRKAREQLARTDLIPSLPHVQFELSATAGTNFGDDWGIGPSASLSYGLTYLTGGLYAHYAFGLDRPLLVLFTVSIDRRVLNTRPGALRSAWAVVLAQDRARHAHHGQGERRQQQQRAFTVPQLEAEKVCRNRHERDQEDGKRRT